MATCEQCRGTILLGGERFGEHRFCSRACYEGFMVRVAERAAGKDQLAGSVDGVFNGPCPVCRGEGPNDVHTAHKVTSFLVATHFSQQAQVCCKRCGNRMRMGALAHTAVLGWWGIPWGLVMTPVRIISNAAGCLGGPPKEPSRELTRVIKVNLGERLAQTALAAREQPQAG